MVFWVIQPTPGLERSARRRAHRLGPEAVAVPTSYPSLLRSAGFGDIEFVDETPDYRAAQQRWIDASQRHADGMRLAMGDDAFDERAETRRQTLTAIDGGLLSRFRYTAARPVTRRGRL